MKLLRRILVVISLCAALLVPQMAVAAPSIFSDACGAGSAGSGADQSAACTATPEPVTGANGILAKATKIIALLAGVAALIMAIVSGLFFVTAEGDPAKMASARTALIGAIVGMVVVLAASSILKFVLTKVG